MKKVFFIIFVMLVIVPMAYAKLSATTFPGTIDDISFKSRIENLTDGYKPFMDKQAYQELNIIPGEEIFTDHMIAVDEASTKEQQIPSLSEPEPSDIQQPTQQQQKQQFTALPPPTEPVYVDTPSYNNSTIGKGYVNNNNYVIGGSCYLADHDANFPNKILTTGKYENRYPAFEKGLITVFRKEGKCGTIKNDPCGYTCYGIGSGSKCMNVVVHSPDEAEEIYYNRFWKKYNLDRLPDVISPDIFIACMASGPGTALSQFRRFLGLPSKTTAVDDEMINAIKNYHGDIHNDWMDVRDKFLQDVARKRYGGSVSRGYKNAIELKRKNGCHVQPKNPLYR